MLRSFRVANHKSFRDEAELLLMPAYDKSRPVVPVAAVFGANASGKSNLLDALRWLQRAVRESYAGWEPGAGIPRTPFRLDPAAADRPSLYAVELILDGQRYTYGVEVDDHRVLTEWLYAYPRNRRRVIFERERDEVRLGSTIADHRARAQQLARQTRDNALLFSVAAHNELTEVNTVYQWFRVSLSLTDGVETAEPDLLRRLRDERERPAAVELIGAADLGISDITVDDNSELATVEEQIATTVRAAKRLLGEAERLQSDDGIPDASVGDGGPDSQRKLARQKLDETNSLIVQLTELQRQRRRLGSVPRLRFYHGSSGVPLLLADQSAGTRSWIGLVSAALATLGQGALMVVDEVDASLHPHLTARLTNLFRDPETNHTGAQLLFTTHDATLLDEETLSRDEVWFVEKEPDSGASRLYPLTDFHPRKHEDREGRYLAGSYGAVPVVSDSGIRRALRNGVRDAAA
jgi:hypothetical protein